MKVEWFHTAKVTFNVTQVENHSRSLVLVPLVSLTISYESSIVMSVF